MLTEGGCAIPNFNYLIKMPMDSVTEEAVEKLMNDKGEKETELELLENTSVKKIWLNELAVLREEYLKFVNSDDEKKKPITIKIKKQKK